MCYYSFLIKKAAIREVFDFTLYKVRSESSSMPERRTEAFAKEEWADKRAAVFIFDPQLHFYFPSNNK
jgi:hypothetical protein